MKRIAVIAACLALLLGSARASVAARMDGSAALLTEDGAEIVAEGAYVDIVPLGGDRFAATADGARYALMDADGALLTAADYDELRLRDGMLLAHRDGGWGLLDAGGAELGAFDYAEILPNGAGGCWALREEDDQMVVLLLDADGGERDSGLRALEAGEPGEGLLPLRAGDGRWGYCDAGGSEAIPARFAWAGSFTGGMAPAVEGGRYGAIGPDGAWIVAPEYDFLEVSDQGFCVAADADGAVALAADGRVLARYPGADVWIALAGEGYLVGDGEGLRVCDASGAMVEALAPDASVSEGLKGQLVISEGMWGEACVRLSGTENRYQNLYPLGTAGGEAVYAALEVDAARYQNDLLHEIQLSVDMDSARYALVDAAGEPLPPGGYLCVKWLADDRFLAQSDGQWRMMNSWGKIYWRSGKVTRTAAPNS